MTDLHRQVADSWAALRERRPLVLCITNRVTPQRVADTLLAAGASPVMADNPHEVGQMAAIASGIYLNTGLHETQPASLEAAARAIEDLDKPAVLDPVGAGATAYRSGEIQRLLESTRFTAIRGNASEIRALAGEGAGARGVDSSDSSDSARDAALALARSTGAIVAVSGERDLITDGEQVVRVGGGHPWLALITGSGCALGALVTACVAASDPWIGTIAAHSTFALATERAMQRSQGPGTLSIHLLDELLALAPEDFSRAPLTPEQAVTRGRA
ncbi:MAG: hydroxyethylthiazole kinase [Chloroflexota bacterium]|nr:hydroxyethylthiazole kinase [Chloroflexota bacterium]